MESLRRILVACDLGDEAARALEYAKHLGALSGAEIVMAHVFDPMPMVPPIALAPGYTIGDEIIGEIRTNIREALERLKSENFPDASKVKLELLEGSSAAHLLCEYAANHKIDLIVVGTHGRKGASRFLLGSVAERIVREAGCSVLVAR